MVVEKNNKVEDYKFKKGNLNFAVVGHVEWINFLKVDQLPKPGVISHSEKSLEYPAGGGSIITMFRYGLFFWTIYLGTYIRSIWLCFNNLAFNFLLLLYCIYNSI